MALVHHARLCRARRHGSGRAAAAGDIGARWAPTATISSLNRWRAQRAGRSLARCATESVAFRSPARPSPRRPYYQSPRPTRPAGDPDRCIAARHRMRTAASARPADLESRAAMIAMDVSRGRANQSARKHRRASPAPRIAEARRHATWARAPPFAAPAPFLAEAVRSAGETDSARVSMNERYVNASFTARVMNRTRSSSRKPAAAR